MNKCKFLKWNELRIRRNSTMLLGFLLVFLVSDSAIASITITGESFFCSAPTGLKRNYVIVGSSETEFEYTVTITGGTLSNIVEKTICTSPYYRPDVVSSTSTTIGFLIGDTPCSFWEISFDITWGSGTTRKIDVKRVGANNHVIKTISAYNDSGAYIAGTSGYVCQSFTGGLFSATGTNATSYVWSSTSTGSSLYIPSGSGCCPYISGFTPNNMYTVNCTLYCNGTLKKVLSVQIFTVNSCKLPIPNKMVNANHIKGLSRPQKLLFDPMFGQIENTADDENISSHSEYLYPNPVKSGSPLLIQIPDVLAVTRVDVFDMLGRLVESIKPGDLPGLSIETTNLSPGNYMARFIGKDFEFVRKFLISD